MLLEKKDNGKNHRGRAHHGRADEHGLGGGFKCVSGRVVGLKVVFARFEVRLKTKISLDFLLDSIGVEK
jgi:hypothetical protein